MKTSIAVLLSAILSIAMLAGCSKGGLQPAGNAVAAASAGGNSVADATGEGGAAQADEGERIRLEISNEDTEKGYLSAVCPAGWYNHSDDEYLFFSESETAGDYTKPYIRLGYAPTATLTGGSGEAISFEMGGRSWDGLFNGDYTTYNMAHQLEGGGGLSAMSMGVGPQDAVFELVVGSIWVEF